MWQPQSFQPAQPAPQAWTPQSFQPSGNQPDGQPPTQVLGANPQAPKNVPDGLAANSNENNNQQDYVQKIAQWANSPTTVDNSDLPQSGQGLNLAQKLGYAGLMTARGLGAVGEDMFVKPAASGLTELLQRSVSPIPPQTDSDQGPPGMLSSNAMNALMMMSPVGVGSNIAKAGITGPVGRQLLDKASVNVPTDAMADSEDQALNTILASNGQPSSSTLMRGLSARDNDALQVASDANFANSSAIYKQARESGAVLNTDAANGLKSTITDALNNNPNNVFIPQLNPKTVGIVQHLSDAIDQNGGIGLDQIDQYRRLLGRVGGSEDGYSAGVIKKSLDNYVGGLDQGDLANGSSKALDLFNNARATFSNASKFEDVTDVLKAANGDPNRIKAGLTKFINNDDNTLGWSDEQKAALRNAANTGVGENVLKAVGKFGLDFSKSGTGNTVLPALLALAKEGGKLGTAAFLPGGVPLLTGTTLMRQGQKYLARGKAEQLLDTLLYQAPEAQIRPGGPAPLQLEPPPNIPPMGGNPVYGSPVGPDVDYNFGQKQLGSQFYAPDSRALTYQPRPDFIGTGDGQVAQQPMNVNDIIDFVRRMKQ